MLSYQYRIYYEICAIRSLHVVCERFTNLSLQGLFVRVVLSDHSSLLVIVVLSYHYMVYLCELRYPVITEFICESCAIQSLHGLFVRVVLFYHYMVYLWELCYPIIPCCLWELSYSIITGCFWELYYLIITVLFVRIVLFYYYRVYFESCAISSLHSFVVRVVLFYHYRVYLWELC